ncbi:MAG: DGQHR domain-containing protein [Deferribacteres bacterium]|nr:DGQHR domain-containing protein [Deferribacteres bacterium]
MKNEISDKIIVPVVRSKMLGVDVYRGFLELSTLSDLSKADVYDQIKNPKGTQRDLSYKHAQDAYTYIKTKEFGFWPEVFLCARNNGVLTFTPISEEYTELGLLQIEAKQALESEIIVISRVDGNHRLHYGNGKEKGFSRINKRVSFCLAFNLSLDEEIQLFKDINKNQKPMNTSHLDNIEVRLTEKDELKKINPELFVAQKLNEDPKSPLKERIYQGGKKPVGVDIPLRGLKTGLQYMFSRTSQLMRLPNVDAQYILVRNYFNAIKKWQPKAWENPKEYLMLRGAGLWAICFLGAQVIDRALIRDKFKVDDFLKVLQSGRDWNWSRNGDFKGYSGRGGALEISNKVARYLQDEDHLSTKNLFGQIMAEDEE